MSFSGEKGLNYINTMKNNRSLRDFCIHIEVEEEYDIKYS